MINAREMGIPRPVGVRARFDHRNTELTATNQQVRRGVNRSNWNGRGMG
jgi:hypothetical protein